MQYLLFVMWRQMDRNFIYQVQGIELLIIMQEIYSVNIEYSYLMEHPS